NSNVDWNVGHSLSAGGQGASSAPLRLWGLPWTRFSRRSLAPSVPINFVLTIRYNRDADCNPDNPLTKSRTNVLKKISLFPTFQSVILHYEKTIGIKYLKSR
ncbi:hypothetical protein, partial [Peribacillus butanolivorans]